MELAIAEAFRMHQPQEKKGYFSRGSEGSQYIGSGGSVRSSSTNTSMRSFFRRADPKQQQDRMSSDNSRPIIESQSEPLAVFRAGREGKDVRPASPSVETNLPSFPPEESLPREDSDDYAAALHSAVQEIQNDYTSGARQLADSALQHLAHITDIAAYMATSWSEFWSMMVEASKQLSKARPSMSAAITSCLLRALERVARYWNDEQSKGQKKGTSDFARIAGSTLDMILQERKDVGIELGHNFSSWLKENLDEISSPGSLRICRILTLSNSSTIRAAILHALSTLPDVKLDLGILESRPRCEGADMAAKILSSAKDKSRLSIQMLPDSAVGTASKDIHIILLGADRISSTGNVSNKIGSLAAAVCAKHHNPSVRVVVLSDSDKVAAPELAEPAIEHHASHELSSAWIADTRCQLKGKENVKIFGEWFEWVPSNLMDVYITELGVLGTKHVEDIATSVGELDEYIFQSRKV